MGPVGCDDGAHRIRANRIVGAVPYREGSRLGRDATTTIGEEGSHDGELAGHFISNAGVA